MHGFVQRHCTIGMAGRQPEKRPTGAACACCNSDKFAAMLVVQVREMRLRFDRHRIGHEPPAGCNAFDSGIA